MHVSKMCTIVRAAVPVSIALHHFLNILISCSNTCRKLDVTCVSSKCRIIIPIPSWLMIYILVSINLCFVLSSPEILVSPETVSVIDGDTAVFYCKARADEIVFFVNGTVADKQIVEDKGFEESAVTDINETTRERTLTTTASIQYNNTSIICRAINTTDLEAVASDPALLLVQDLTSVGDLQYLFIDLSTVNISWSPPFALPSTSVAKYNISYNISVTSNGTTTNYFTSNSYFVLQLSNITDSPCDEINVTVSRYNTVSGIISMPVITFHLPSVASFGSFSPSIMVELNETDMLVGITFSINVSELCPREYPEHSEIKVFRSDSRTLADEQTFPVSISENAIIIVKDAFTLNSNERYTAEIFFQNPDGNFNISGAVNFSTFAVQSVWINELSTFLKVECVFAPNTEATGCEVKIAFSLNNEVVRNTTMRANRTGDSALITFLKAIADEYLLYVFEIEKTGSVVQVDPLTGLFTLATQQFTSKSVSRVLSTTPTLFPMASSTYFISPSVSSSMESGSGSENNDEGRRTYIIIIATVVPTTCIITAGGSIILVILLVRKYQRRNNHGRPSRPIIDDSECYTQDPTQEQYIQQKSSIGVLTGMQQDPTTTSTLLKDTDVSYHVHDQDISLHIPAVPAPEEEQTQAILLNKPTEETEKATLLDGTSVAKFSLRKSISDDDSYDGSDDGSDDDMTSTVPLLQSSQKSYTKNKKQFKKQIKTLRQEKPKAKKKKVPHSYHVEFDMSTTESILLMMDEDTLDVYSTLEQSEDSNKLEASEFVFKRRRTSVTDPDEDSQMGVFSSGTQDEKNKAEKEYITHPGTFDKELESSEMMFGKNKSQDQKIEEVEVVVLRQTPKAQKKAPKEIKPENEKSNNPIVVPRQKVNVPSTENTPSIKGGVYASLSDFNYAPKPRLTNDSVTYVDSASLFPSWQPPVPPKRNRIGETSQGDPLWGESQKKSDIPNQPFKSMMEETEIKPGGLCTPSERDKGGVDTSLSNFKGVPKAPPPIDSVTYVDSASLCPSRLPPVPPKWNRVGKTSQGDPFLEESQQHQSTAL